MVEQAAGRPFVLQSNDLRIQAQAAASGMGIACLPVFMAQEYGLETAKGDDRATSIALWLVVHEDVRATPRIKAVCDFIMEQVRPLLRL